MVLQYVVQYLDTESKLALPKVNLTKLLKSDKFSEAFGRRYLFSHTDLERYKAFVLFEQYGKFRNFPLFAEEDGILIYSDKSVIHFRWYKSVFFSKVFQRKDSNMDFWKERFLAGLPALFAERVRTRIKNKYGGSIPWHVLTYGDISSEIVAEGLAICTEQKLQRKMDKGSTKKTLGDFCEQYGYNESSSKPPKHRSKNKDQRRQQRRKKPYLNSGKRKKKTPIYYRHEVDYIDDILNTDSDSKFIESSSSSEEDEQCNCDHYKSILMLNGLSINMLKKEDSLILDCIDALDDPVNRRSDLENYVAMASEKKPSDRQLETPK
ncbi:hypothetical protein ACOSP7_016774 [Xanthoceras sorbifolium]